MKDRLMGCHSKDTVKVQVVSKITMWEVAQGGFQKCFKQLYNCTNTDKSVYFEDNCI